MICYIKGVNPGLNPGFGILRLGLSCDLDSGVNEC
jgi:hypothetical protein